MKKYKVLEVEGKQISPYQLFIDGKLVENFTNLEDIFNRKMVFNDFDKKKNHETGKGFTGVDADGLIKYDRKKSNRVFEVEFGGRKVIYDTYNQRFSEQTILRMLEPEEVEALVKDQSEKMGWDYYQAYYPVNPFGISPNPDMERAKELLLEWASLLVSVSKEEYGGVDHEYCGMGTSTISKSVVDSISDRVGGSTGKNVFSSVERWLRQQLLWNSIRESFDSNKYYFSSSGIFDSYSSAVAAYISSLFPNIRIWKYIEHVNGENPFQSCIDLWHMGLVPTFVAENSGGKTLRLHQMCKNGRVIYQGEWVSSYCEGVKVFYWKEI